MKTNQMSNNSFEKENGLVKVEKFIPVVTILYVLDIFIYVVLVFSQMKKVWLSFSRKY